METRKTSTNEYLQLQQSPIYWSEKKFQEMESALTGYWSSLTGYWSSDIWDGRDNPYKDRERTSLILNFEGLPRIFKTEIKYAIYIKMYNYEWSWNTVHVNNVLKNLIDTLKTDTLSISDQSIINRHPSYWELKLTEYFAERGKLYSVTSHTCNKYGQPQFYKSKDQKIHVFNHIYKFLADFYDLRDEYDKDIWDTNKLKSDNKTKARYLDFTELKNSWLFEPSRHYIKYQLAIHASGTVYGKLRYIRIFGNFIFEKYPQLKPEDLNREIIVDYISFIKNLSNASYIYQHHCLSYLKELLELCQRENWVNIPSKQLIYLDDFPKSKRKVNPNYIPDEVVRKIYQHIEEVPYPIYGRMFLLQMQIGCRVSDLRHLEYSCLVQSKKEQYILKFWNSKQSRQHTVPVSEDIVNLIRIQQKEVREELGENYPYLFPSRRVKIANKVKPVSSKAYSEAIKKLIWDNDIRDNNGNRWVFTSHQCRHTVATSMINDGVPQHIVQRYLVDILTRRKRR